MSRNASPGRASTPSWPFILVGILVVLGVVLVIVTTRQHEAPPDEQAQWEAEHRQEVVRLNNDAESLALQGNLKDAHGKYQAMARLVAGRQMRDASLAEIVS